MSKKRTQAKTDPELLRQLEAATTDQALVQAVFTLQLPKSHETAPERVEELTHQVLNRVADKIGADAHEVNIFRNLGAFVVSAPAPFINALLTQPEIASATANRQPESGLISPRKKTPVV